MIRYNSAFSPVCRSMTALRVGAQQRACAVRFVTGLLLLVSFLIPAVSHAQIPRDHLTEQDVAALCGEQLDPQERVVTGMVRDGASGSPVEGATVELRWSENGVQGRRGRGSTIFTDTDAEGQYTVCRLPLERAVTLRADHTDRVSRVVALRFDDRGAELEGTIFPNDRPVWRVDLTLTSTPALRGRVLAEGTSQPLQSATVELIGKPGYAETADDGRFEVAGAPAGSTRVRVRAVGYRPQVLVGTLVAHEITDIGDVVLQPLPPELEPIEVTAEAPRHQRLVSEGFYERRERGLGEFVDAEEIENWHPTMATDVMRRVPGVRVRYVGYVQGRRGLYDITMSRRQSITHQSCPPVLYLDGTQLGTLAEYDINEVILINSVAGIEVYSSAAQVPPRYNSAGAACGIIVVWTK